MFGAYDKLYKLKSHYFKNAYIFLNCSYSNVSRNSRNLQNVLFKSYSVPSLKNDKFDIAVVGTGIIGLGTALELKKRLPCYSICVVDKEATVAFHQSTRNSGVIHAGIYYTPGSLRAKLCVDGMYLMYKFCEEFNIPYKRNGKLIIAVNKQEVKWLEDLFVRGQQNNVPGLELLDTKQFQEIEPHMVGLKAIYSPYTGVVSYGDVTRSYASQFKTLGGNLIMNFEVVSISESAEGDGTTGCDVSGYPVTITAKDGRVVKAGFLLTCGGLHSDSLAQMTGESPVPKILPFRGEYFLLNPEKNCLVNGNVYPVPDPSMPFIGVHFTPKVDGSVWLGPTAMLAYKKEGYKWTDFDFGEVCDMIKFKGMQKFVYKHFRGCVYELVRSFSKRVILKELQLYMPSLRLKDVLPGVLAGVQAQAMDIDGKFCGDFSICAKPDKKIMHIRNAPSPSATSSLAIGNYLATEVQKHL